MENEDLIRDKYKKITLTLIEKKLTITTMESCTAGTIASLLTDTEGSSSILKGAFITYSNEAKILQGVPSSVIDEYGVYSVETALEMAKACQNTYKADIGIGVTGTMGNIDPSNNDSVPGEVFAAIIFKTPDTDKSKAFHFTLPAFDTRREYKLAVADRIADELLAHL